MAFLATAVLGAGGEAFRAIAFRAATFRVAFFELFRGDFRAVAFLAGAERRAAFRAAVRGRMAPPRLAAFFFRPAAFAALRLAIGGSNVEAVHRVGKTGV